MWGLNLILVDKGDTWSWSRVENLSASETIGHFETCICQSTRRNIALHLPISGAGYPMYPLWPGPWFNIKIISYQYRKSHCGDKTVVRSSYLQNGISYTGKMSFLYWIGALTTLSWRTCGWVSHVPIVTRPGYPDGPEAGYPMYPLWPDYVILTDLRLGIPCAHCDQTTLSWRTWSWVSHVPIVTRLRYPDGPEAGYPMYPLWPDYVILTDLRLGIPCAHCDQTTLSWRTWSWVSHVPIVTRLRYPDGPDAGYPMYPLWPDYVILTDLRLGIPCTHCDQTTLSWRTRGWVSHVPIVTRLRYPDGPEAGYPMCPLWPDYVILTDLMMGIPCTHCDQATLSWRTWGWVSHVLIVTRLRYPDGPEAGYPMCPLWPDYVILTDLRLGIPCAHCDQTTLSWRTWGWVSHVPIVTRLRYPDGPEAGYPMCPLWPDYVVLTDLWLGIPYPHCDQTTLP